MPIDPVKIAFPPIIGTGFFAHEDGMVVTNDHVIQELKKIRMPADRNANDWGFRVMCFQLTELGVLSMFFDIRGIAELQAFEHRGPYYGGAKPDMGIVHVDIRKAPALLVSSETPREGQELATAGFPMGTDALTAPGYLHQMCPTLQRGIVSAILPCECNYPHAFTLNVMARGGASGSPVFRGSDGAVVGVLYAALEDIQLTGTQPPYTVPTNISYVVPGHYVKRMIAQIASSNEFAPTSETWTFEEFSEWGVRQAKERMPPDTTWDKQRPFTRLTRLDDR
jgi:S1-C subfamily serine protease